MQTFSLKQPCQDCPFRKDVDMLGSLRPGRMKEITDNLKTGGTFPCHKTIDYNKERIDGKMDLKNEKFCAGAMGYVYNQGIGHPMLRLAEFYDFLKPDEIKDLDKIINDEDL